MFDLWWLSGDDQTEARVRFEFVGDVRSLREAFAAGQEHAADNPGLGGLYRLCNEAGNVLAQFTARSDAVQALPLAEPDYYAEETIAYRRAA